MAPYISKKLQYGTFKGMVGDNLADVDPEEAVRVFSVGSSTPETVARRTGFPRHKEMENFMRRSGYVWSSTSVNYKNINPPSIITSLNICPESEDSLKPKDEAHKRHSLSDVMKNDNYVTLLEYLWQYREKLIKVIESLNDGDKITIYHIPGQAKTKSIYLLDALTELMIILCQKHSLSQNQGYEAALVEYLSKYGLHDRIEQLLKVVEDS